jgi:hypothetical protein
MIDGLAGATQSGARGNVTLRNFRRDTLSVIGMERSGPG